MSKLERSVVSLVELFEQYAGQDEHKNQLSAAELKQLLEKELTCPEFKKKINAEEVQEAMEMLDKNHDGEINFREFCQFVGMLAKGYFKQKRCGKNDRRREDKS
ncbi:S100 calcium binding protein W [Megalops cyprinoides]|uniref:S100 calcium binding protein W n=1 Tax=Megalops cyprinoides TaxID=118141 RepID=UPI0018642A3D|nr:S100 calcium binding protein W [Megalops cyprinoides]